MADSPQLALPVAAHYNHQLFSDHYLNEILPSQPAWRAMAVEAAAAFAEIRQLFAAYTPSRIEAQVEDELIRPILQRLGHDYDVQPALKTPDGTKKPDYVFYRDGAAKAAHKDQTLTDILPREGGLAVGDAKYWGRPLDVAIKTNDDKFFTNNNPSYQIAFYVLHSGVAWGILTNGRQWRLYHKDTAHKLDVYYEVDLAEMVDAGDAERFRYFYAFFRRAAFDDGPLSLATMLRASVDYAHAVGSSLKVQVYDALRHLAQGFLDYAPNGLRGDPETLKAIYDNALILLYRLIFILYAEARELLPVRDSDQYRESYSLYAIKQAVARDLTFGRHQRPPVAAVEGAVRHHQPGQPPAARGHLQRRPLRPAQACLPGAIRRGRCAPAAGHRQTGPRGRRLRRLPRPLRAPYGHHLRGAVGVPPAIIGGRTSR
ncbi:MAG: hypothetical protein ACYDBB_19365 [Armatimonadota bacterium]